MLLIVGALVVLAAIVAGYLMEGGVLLALYQPAELVIIGGAALGSLLISTPMPLLKRIAGSFGALFKGGPGKQDYLEMLGMMYQTFRLTQQSGVMALEAHCDDPQSSSIFSRFPKFLANHHAVDFFTDSVRMIIMGGVSPFDLESMMDVDLEVHHHESLKPAQAIAKVGDALPGMGIVAAVLGVVITMGAIDGPASEIGHKVGAALVGTFLGILLCYGFVGPMATSLEHKVDFEGQYLATIKCGILALSKGLAPAIAVEFARRSIPSEVRPSFSETEQVLPRAAARGAGRGGMSPGGPPIIVKRRKAAHHGHHGGAWKVAYADFVTALMAFFLVMWLVGQSKAVRSAVAGYFRDPGIFDQARSDGPIAGGDLRLAPEAAPKNEAASGDGMAESERAALEETAKRIRQRIAESPDLRSLGRQIEIQVTRDGLRIELVDAESQTFFASGSAALAAGTEKVLQLIARELGELKNSIVIEGHTDSQPYAVTDIYSNWELSADRANAARRVMERSGLHGGQVRGVRGYADRQLRVGDAPLDPRNRRVSVIVEHLFKTSSLPAAVRELASGGAKPASNAAAIAPPSAAPIAAPARMPGVAGPSPH